VEAFVAALFFSYRRGPLAWLSRMGRPLTASGYGCCSNSGVLSAVVAAGLRQPSGHGIAPRGVACGVAYSSLVGCCTRPIRYSAGPPGTVTRVRP
jgi:hypothetical protein